MTLTVHQLRVVRCWMLALVFGAAAVLAAHHIGDVLPPPRPLEELSYYPSGQHLEPATLGHAETAADLAWLRAVQYYGAHRLTDDDYSKIEHVFDVLTTLAPGFTASYEFGAFALAQEGRNFPAAERLMLKGLAANPSSGPLAFQLGFLYYVRPGGRDLPHAAQYFEQASWQTDAPPQSLHFAAFARQNSGDLHVAYELWSDVARTSKNRYLREIAGREMDRIRVALATGHTDLAVKRLAVPHVVFR